jgi:ParB family chromosome partitioning protein
MKRLRDTGRDRTIQSRCYENAVLPQIKKSDRILDFGAGQMDYVKKLRREGYDIHGVEFYLRTPKSNQLDISRVHKHIDQLCDSLKSHGLYDVVICDSVINSVTSVEAERAVLTTVNALCRKGGLIVFSGRARGIVDRLTQKRKVSTGKTRDVWFLDRDGITAMYQRGVWLYQKFHNLAQVKELGARYIGPHFEVVDHDRPGGAKTEIRSSSFAVHGRKLVEFSPEEVHAALKFEFNLPLPEGKRYGRGADICAAWDAAKKVRSKAKI